MDFTPNVPGKSKALGESLGMQVEVVLPPLKHRFCLPPPPTRDSTCFSKLAKLTEEHEIAAVKLLVSFVSLISECGARAQVLGVKGTRPSGFLPPPKQRFHFPPLSINHDDNTSPKLAKLAAQHEVDAVKLLIPLIPLVSECGGRTQALRVKETHPSGLLPSPKHRFHPPSPTTNNGNYTSSKPAKLGTQHEKASVHLLILLA